MRRASLLLCTLPILAQEARTPPPFNTVFYAQTEPSELGLISPGAFGVIRSAGKGEFILHLWVSVKGAYFGCDAVFQPRSADGSYFVTFQPLNRRGPDLAKNFHHSGMGDPSSWTYGPPAVYPLSQVVAAGETLAIDLTPAGKEERRLIGEGKRLVGYLEMSELVTSRAAVEAQLKNVTTIELLALYARLVQADQELNGKWNETLQEIARQIRSTLLPPRPPSAPAPRVSGVARELSADDAELELVFPAVYFNDVLRGRSLPVDLRGPLPWLYLPERGRFIFSLVPRRGFEQAGKVKGRALVIKSGEDTIAVRCAGPITREDDTYIVYVRHDRDWRPDPTPPPDDPSIGKLNPAELRNDR